MYRRHYRYALRSGCAYYWSTAAEIRVEIVGAPAKHLVSAAGLDAPIDLRIGARLIRPVLLARKIIAQSEPCAPVERCAGDVGCVLEYTECIDGTCQIQPPLQN